MKEISRGSLNCREVFLIGFPFPNHTYLYILYFDSFGFKKLRKDKLLLKIVK